METPVRVRSPIVPLDRSSVDVGAVNCKIVISKKTQKEKKSKKIMLDGLTTCVEGWTCWAVAILSTLGSIWEDKKKIFEKKQISKSEIK